jgi:hypothetical protein
VSYQQLTEDLWKWVEQLAWERHNSVETSDDHCAAAERFIEERDRLMNRWK